MKKTRFDVDLSVNDMVNNLSGLISGDKDLQKKLKEFVDNEGLGKLQFCRIAFSTTDYHGKFGFSSEFTVYNKDTVAKLAQFFKPDNET